MGRSDPEVEEFWDDAEAGPVVRPYAMTRGRTEPTGGTFDLISLVVATRPVPAAEVGLEPEHMAIVALCRHLLSIAEVSALLDLPIGIVRVLIGDLVDRSLLAMQSPELPRGARQDALFEAVLHGLHEL
jgi:hypothetical protein